MQVSIPIFIDTENVSGLDPFETTEFSQVQQDLMSISITQRFLKVKEETELRIQISNPSNKTTTFIYSVSAPNFYFRDQENENQGFMKKNVTLFPLQIKNFSLLCWIKLDDKQVISTVQVLYANLHDVDQNSTLSSVKDWVWVYSDFNEMIRPKITKSPFPLFFSEDIFVYYSIHFNESAPTGYIRFHINNMIDETQEYRIIISNNSQSLKFETVFYNGFHCSLVCGDKNAYEARFSYSLPNGSLWALIPLSVRFFLDSDLLIHQNMLIELRNNDINSEEILEKKGSYRLNSSEQISVKVPINAELEGNFTVFTLSNRSGVTIPILLDTEIREDSIYLKINEETFSESLVLFIYNPESLSLFTSSHVSLVEVEKYPIETTSNKMSSFLILLSSIAIAILVLVNKKHRK